MFKMGWILLFVLNGVVFADCSCHFEKLYVKPDQIVFKESAIYILLEDSSLQTNAIYSDNEGLYFIASQEKRDCKSPEWWCAFCKRCNAYWYSRCPKCQHWR